MKVEASIGVPHVRTHPDAWEAAKKLEASFLSEMLKNAGLGETESTFGGGVGESQFSSFLRDAQAQSMVDAGGIGLAEVFYHALKEADYDARRK